MSWHVETQGSGSPLLLLHGWGMHSGMWAQVVGELSKSHRVHSVDLPGYAGSNTCTPYDLDTLVQQLSVQFNEAMTLVGWSLGGQLALRWAQLHPAQVSKLVLVATTPCFVQKENWNRAMAAEILQEFAGSLLQNHAQTLRRFLALQVRGSENEKQLLSDFRAQLFAKGEPAMEALKGGLEILRNTDLRVSLPHVLQPVLLLAGERDTLTPLAAMQYMLEKMPHAHLHVIKGAAHAPFLSHKDEFVAEIIKFLVK